MREGDDEIGFYFFFSLFSLHSCPLLLDRGSGGGSGTAYSQSCYSMLFCFVDFGSQSFVLGLPVNYILQ